MIPGTGLPVRGLPGVVRTRVGYTGGTTSAPTYHGLGDHTESIQIDFDPARITFAQLVDVFWTAHDPREGPWSRQYRAAVFYHDEGQMREAVRAREREAARIRGTVHTEILPAGPFYRAEAYHQKFALRREGELAREILTIYPKEAELVDSTAAARINGYVAGYGSLRQLREEWGSLGLSERGGRHLWEIVRGFAARRGNREAQGMACPVR